MAPESAAQLIRLWNPAGRAPAHRRLAALLSALDGADARRDDTLGARNRRLLTLHQALVGTPLEARVQCAHCGLDNEFTIPADDILALPLPADDARVQIRSDRQTLSFRLPRMTDIEAAGDASSVAQVRQTVLDRCRVDGDANAMTEAEADHLAREFETLDPAANVAVTISCANCGRAMTASVDLASFIVREVDQLVQGFYRDVDVIASAYGWDEPTILALPAERRRRYVKMIAARTEPRRTVQARTR